jgi:hypothetical protein
MNDSSSDPIRDRVLRDALREVDDLPTDVDWVRLRRSIQDRAALPLARRRSRRDRVRWIRPLVPSLAAAGLAAVLSLQLTGVGGGGIDDPAEEGGVAALRPVFEEVLGAPLSEAELDLLLGEVSADRLVLATLAMP